MLAQGFCVPRVKKHVVPAPCAPDPLPFGKVRGHVGWGGVLQPPVFLFVGLLSLGIQTLFLLG